MRASTSPASRTAAAVAARRARTEALLERVTKVITRLERERAVVSFAAVARQAGVSRTFLYENTTARQRMADAAVRDDRRRSGENTSHRHDEPAWRERARNAEDALKAAHAEIRAQRNQNGELLGRIRDLECDDTLHAVSRLTAENTTLKQRTHELLQENRQLEERLHAARSNARFMDKRIADLEAELVNSAGFRSDDQGACWPGPMSAGE